MSITKIKINRIIIHAVEHKQLRFQFSSVYLFICHAASLKYNITKILKISNNEIFLRARTMRHEEGTLSTHDEAPEHARGRDPKHAR